MLPTMSIIIVAGGARRGITTKRIVVVGRARVWGRRR